jgi:hypothetical protein
MFNALERQAAGAAPERALDGFFEVLDRLDQLTARR